LKHCTVIKNVEPVVVVRTAKNYVLWFNHVTFSATCSDASWFSILTRENRWRLILLILSCVKM